MIMWLIYMAASGSRSDEATPASTAVADPPAAAADLNMIKASEALPIESTMKKLDGAVQDPEKVAVLECLGVKVYEDPQPEGHPPPPEACAAIKAKIDRRAEEMRQADAASAVEHQDSAIQAFREMMAAPAASAPLEANEP